MHVESEETRENLLKRLRRIEGQVKGIQRMLEEDRDCRDIVQQLSAVRSAVHHAGLEIMKVYATQCLTSDDSDQQGDEVIEYLVTALGKWT